MPYKKISDYGIVGNGLTLALIGIDGSLDWMCLPYMDSPSVFAAILDADKGGRFRVEPSADYDSVQSYLPRTNILKTLFRSESGQVELLDFMVVDETNSGDDKVRNRLLRRIRGLSGKLNLELEFSPRFDYARGVVTGQSVSPGQRLYRHGDLAVTLFCTPELAWNNDLVKVEIEPVDLVSFCPISALH